MAWDSIAISDLIKDISIGPFGSDVKKEFFCENGIPFLSGHNLSSFKVNDESLVFMEREKALSKKKCLAHRKDVVVTYVGNLGSLSYIPEDSKYEEYLISQRQFRLTCNERILPEFLVYYLHTKKGQHDLLSNVSTTGVPTMASPTTNFKKILVPVPPIEVQSRIVYIIELIQSMIQSNKKINDNLGGVFIAS